VVETKRASEIIKKSYSNPLLEREADSAKVDLPLEHADEKTDV